MRAIFFVLALLIGLVIAGVAMINNEVVTVSYYFGQVSLTLFMLILGSAVAGALFMGSLGIFRGIGNYMNSQGDRGLKKELTNRVKTLEDEKRDMEDELKKQQKEREDAAAKSRATLEDEKRKLEDELRKQQKDREEMAAKVRDRETETVHDREDAAAKSHSSLEDENRKLEDELRRQQRDREEMATTDNDRATVHDR